MRESEVVEVVVRGWKGWNPGPCSEVADGEERVEADSIMIIPRMKFTADHHARSQ